MVNCVSTIPSILLGAYIFLLLADALISQEQQESFKQDLKDAETYLSKKGARWTALAPLHGMSFFLNKYLGKRFFSLRSTVMASAFVFILITIIGLTSFVSRSGDFVDHSPFKMWKNSIEISNTISHAEKESDEYKTLRESQRNLLLTLDKWGGQYIFSIVLLLACALTVVSLTSLTLAITRKTLDETITASGIVTLVGGMLFNIVLMLLLGSIFLLIMYFINTNALNIVT